MTVVLALACRDGLVLAADSQITDEDRDMSYPGQKLHPLGDEAAWGGSGARGVLTDLEQRLDTSPEVILGADDVGRALQEEVVPILRHHYTHFVEDVPGEPSATSPSAYVLAAGYRNGRPWIVEVDPHGLLNRYAEIGFHAIGSGAPMAQQAGALLAHFRMTERELRYGLLAVVRVLDALTRTAPNVGGPLDIVAITPDGARWLSDEDVAEQRQRVEQWEDAEQRLLDHVFEDDPSAVVG